MKGDNTMKTLITTLAVLTAALCFSAPRPPMHHGPRPAPRVFHRPPPPPRHVHHHHRPSPWPVIAGVGIGTTVAEIFRPSPPPPVVIQSTPTVVQPVVVSPTVQRVWVPGYWQETRDSYGRVISRTWIEGYWRYQ